MPASVRSTGPAAPTPGIAGLSVSMTSRPCDMITSPTDSRDMHLLGKLDQLGGERRLPCVVLPGGRAGDRAPLLDDGIVEVVDRGALLGVDIGHLLVVGHRLLGAEILHFDPERHDLILLALRQRVEYLLGTECGLRNEPVG